MDQAVDLDSFRAAPVGKYLAGSTWLYFYANPRLSGFVLWGRLTETDLQQPARITPAIHQFAEKPHVAFIDARRVEQVDAAAFAIASDYVTTHRLAIKSVIARLAIVHAPGLFGAVAAGFFQIVKPPYQVELFANPIEAMTWLEVDQGPDLIAELDMLHAMACGTTPLLRDLRSLLRGRLRDVALPDAARTLGISERSLQRRLAEHGTSFQHEVALARVRLAEELLADTEASLTEIGYTVGCASLHHFSSVFRKVTGETPSQWRERNRKGA